MSTFLWLRRSPFSGCCYYWHRLAMTHRTRGSRCTQSMKKTVLPKIGCIIIILWTGADGGFHLFYFTPLTIFDGVISPPTSGFPPVSGLAEHGHFPATVIFFAHGVQLKIILCFKILARLCFCRKFLFLNFNFQGLKFYVADKKMSLAGLFCSTYGHRKIFSKNINFTKKL